MSTEMDTISFVFFVSVMSASMLTLKFNNYWKQLVQQSRKLFHLPQIGQKAKKRNMSLVRDTSVYCESENGHQLFPTPQAKTLIW